MHDCWNSSSVDLSYSLRCLIPRITFIAVISVCVRDFCLLVIAWLIWRSSINLGFPLCVSCRVSLCSGVPPLLFLPVCHHCTLAPHGLWTGSSSIQLWWDEWNDDWSHMLIFSVPLVNSSDLIIDHLRAHSYLLSLCQTFSNQDFHLLCNFLTGQKDLLTLTDIWLFMWERRGYSWCSFTAQMTQDVFSSSSDRPVMCTPLNVTPGWTRPLFNPVP